MTKAELENLVEKEKITTIKALRDLSNLSLDQIIDLTCDDEIDMLRFDHGKVSVLTVEEAVESLKTVSETTLRRRKARGLGEPPRYIQEAPGTKIFYPFREIAAEMYLEAHPITYGVYSLARIIRNRHD